MCVRGGGGGALPTTYRDYLINSKVHFSFFNNVPIRVSYACSRKRRRPGQGTRTGAGGHYTLCKSFSTTVRFCDNKETAPFCLLVDSNNMLNDPIVGNSVLIKFIVGVKSYIYKFLALPINNRDI